MKKQVRESSAAKALSAYVILNKKGVHVATVHVNQRPSRTQVDVWHNYQRNTKPTELQQGSASGYGYDKFTSALAGLVIDGHVMSDHCDTYGAPAYPKGMTTYPRGTEPKKGWYFTNFSEDGSGNKSCFRCSGFAYLEALGYLVIKAI